MEKSTSIDQINRRLLSYVANGQQRPYTLDRMRELMDRLGNPQDTLRIVHVAGTSGKTSTAYYIAAFLKEAGFKVGLTVSPHIVKVSERAQINLQPVQDGMFVAAMNEFLNLIDAYMLQPTYFEVLVAFAYWFFAKQDVDYAVVEVGVGGLLDGTNVINRADKTCVITDIGMDHTEILGETIEEIAAQKAGIIQPGNPVWMNQQSKVIEAVIAARCAQSGAPLTILKSTYHIPDVSLGFLPDFQRRNSALAYAVVGAMIGRSLQSAQIVRAVSIVIPGRMEVFHYKSHVVILDGAHNEQKIAALVAAVKTAHLDGNIQLVVSFGQNKSSRLDENLRLLSTISNSVIFTCFQLGGDAPRTAIEPGELARRGKGHFESIAVERSAEKAFQQALSATRSVVIVVGSFYLLNHIRPLLIEHAAQKH